MTIIRTHGVEQYDNVLRVRFPIAPVKRQIWIKWKRGKPKPKSVKIICGDNILIDINPDAARLIEQFGTGVKLPSYCAKFNIDDISRYNNIEMLLYYDVKPSQNFVSVITCDTPL